VTLIALLGLAARSVDDADTVLMLYRAELIRGPSPRQCVNVILSILMRNTRSLIILELEQILVKGDLCPVQVPVCSVYKFRPIAFVLDKHCIVCLRCTCRCKVKTQTSGSAI